MGFHEIVYLGGAVTKMFRLNSFVANLVTNVVTNIIFVLVVGVMVTVVTTDLMVTMVTDVPVVTFGPMVTKASKSYQCSLCGVIMYVHCMCFALQTFSVLNPVVTYHLSLMIWYQPAVLKMVYYT